MTDYFSINCRKEEIRNLVFNLSDFFIFHWNPSDGGRLAASGKEEKVKRKVKKEKTEEFAVRKGGSSVFANARIIQPDPDGNTQIRLNCCNI